MPIAISASTSPDRRGSRRRLPSVKRAAGSLMTQLLAVFVLATLLPLMVSLVLVQRDRVAAEQRAGLTAMRGARVAAAQAAQVLQGARSIALVIEQLPSFWAGEDTVRDTNLAKLVVIEPLANSLVFLTPDLHQHGASNWDLARGDERTDLSTREYTREALATGQLAVSAERVTAVTGQIALPVAIPMRPDGQDPPRGYLVVLLSAERLPALWEDVPLASGATIMLVDTRAGHILAGSGDASAIVGGTLAPDNLQRILDDEEYTWAPTPLRGGGDRLRVWTPVEGTPWVVVVDVPSESVFGAADTSARQAIGVAVAAGGIAAFALALLWRHLAGRLGALQDSAARWAGGDWKHRSRVFWVR
jgi:hypothetical protein